MRICRTGLQDTSCVQILLQLSQARHREKVVHDLKKGLGILPCLRPCHNRVRPHQGADGRISGEVTGIRIEGDNKWKAMIQAVVKAEATI